MGSSKSRKSNYLIYILLALACVSVYWQVYDFGFVGMDDFLYASQNERVLSGINAETVRWAFTTNYSANWHPITWLSLMLDAEIAVRVVPGFADKPTAGVFHITNVALHTLNTLLLFAALFAMTGNRWRSAFVAALFALHPLHVESVAWVSERKDVLSTLFWMLTMLCYAAYVRAPSRKRYALTIATFALGLMSKPMLVSLPIVLILLDWWPLNRSAIRHPKGGFGPLMEKLPFFALAAVSSVLTLWAQRASGAIVELELAPLGERLANAAVSTIAYIVKAISPANLAVFYPHPGPTLPVLHTVGAILAIIAGCAMAVVCARRYRVFTIGWLWYLITLVPVIGIVQVGSQAMADRYTYVPLIGLFIAATWGAADLFAYAQSRFSSFLLTRPTKILLAVGVLVGLGVTSYFQVGYWRNTIALTRHAIAVTKDNYFAHAMLGAALHDAGRDDEALEHCVESIRIRRDYSDGHYRLGTVLAAKGLFGGAVEHFRMALRTDPNNAHIYNDLGCALGKLGDIEGAMKAFETALEIDPEHRPAAKNLKAVLDAIAPPGESE